MKKLGGVISCPTTSSVWPTAAHLSCASAQFLPFPCKKAITAAAYFLHSATYRGGTAKWQQKAASLCQSIHLLLSARVLLEADVLVNVQLLLPEYPPPFEADALLNAHLMTAAGAQRFDEAFIRLMHRHDLCTG
eukprot:1159780-Pelagomonas_calceolata.AAC.3